MSATAVRDVGLEDLAEVDALLDSAFPTRAEADLVAAMRAVGDLVVELVAERNGRLIGHVAFCRLEGDGRARVAALAPLAVAEADRRGGVGAALVREGLSRLAAAGGDWCLVLGDGAYYGRFGFRAGDAAGFSTPYDGPHQQAVRLSPDAPPAGGRLRYPAAFDALG